MGVVTLQVLLRERERERERVCLDHTVLKCLSVIYKHGEIYGVYNYVITHTYIFDHVIF